MGVTLKCIGAACASATLPMHNGLTFCKLYYDQGNLYHWDLYNKGIVIFLQVFLEKISLVELKSSNVCFAISGDAQVRIWKNISWLNQGSLVNNNMFWEDKVYFSRNNLELVHHL